MKNQQPQSKRQRSALQSSARCKIQVSQFILAFIVTVCLFEYFSQPQTTPIQQAINTERFIIQGDNVNSVQQVVEQLGGKVTHKLFIINSVSAEMNNEQIEQLKAHPKIKKLYRDYKVISNFRDGDSNAHFQDDDDSPELGFIPDDNYAKRVGADLLHDNNIDGTGITIAFVDTGVQRSLTNLTKNQDGNHRLLVQYNAITDEIETKPKDKNGHGSHVASITLASDFKDNKQSFTSIAPNANLVSIKAFDKHGHGSYADVIRALDWVLRHKDIFDIRVLNLSFSAEPSSFYWEDPINQAVMKAWQAGVVVITSAGNSGPEAMTIGVPGNTPYVITVGAASNNETSSNFADDSLTGFSAAGPTVEGFVKPDLVAPGSRILGLMKHRTKLGRNHGDNFVAKQHFAMSGTSQSTAIVTGVAALLLQQEPTLTPDEIKCRLIDGARPAIYANGELAYSLFQQGAGMVNASDSNSSPARNCANLGLDIEMELNNTAHFAGPTRRDGQGVFFLTDEAGYEWDGISGPVNGHLSSDGYMWRGINKQPARVAGFWQDGAIWQNGELWSEEYKFEDGMMEKDGYMWRGTKKGTRKASLAATSTSATTYTTATPSSMFNISLWVQE